MTQRDALFRRKQGIVVGLGVLATGVVAATGQDAPTWFTGLVPPADSATCSIRPCGRSGW